MPRYNVERDDGCWACFSTVVDDFITDFMQRNQYDDWRKQQYGKNWSPIEECNIMEYDQAIRRSLVDGYNQ